MIEKALIIIIFMYCTSFSMLSAQYVLGDVYGITLTSPVTGQAIKSNLLNSIVQINSLNHVELNATSISNTGTVNNPIGTAAQVAWELIQLLTGTYIFNVLYLLGVPAIFIAGLVVVYGFLEIRAIVGYIRGISNDKMFAKLFQYNTPERMILCIGHSMKNIMRLAVVKESKQESYYINDIVSFIGNNNVKYCHRIVEINNEHFTARGDNLSKSQDYEINLPIKSIEGKIVWSYPNWNTSN